MVRDRSLGLLPGVRDVAEILIVLNTIRKGKGLNHFHLELIHSAAKERSPALAPAPWPLN